MEQLARINGIPTRLLGSTRERVTVIGVGGYHQGKGHDRDLGIRIIRTAIDEGVNFLDNAWCYNDGDSERFMGEALRNGYRERVFLMTKNHGRDAETFRKQLDQSLQRLQTDVIDLLQFHEIIHEGLPQRIFSEGAIEAAVDAREQGKIRYIGFTGHEWPHLLRQMLSRDFPWDTVQMPVNVLDAHYRSFTRQILPILGDRGIGVIGMKSLAGGQIRKTDIGAEEAIGWSLSQPIDTLVSGWENLDDLRRNVEIVRNWQPMPPEKQAELLQRAARWAADGKLERYKTA